MEDHTSMKEVVPQVGPFHCINYQKLVLQNRKKIKVLNGDIAGEESNGKGLKVMKVNMEKRLDQ